MVDLVSVVEQFHDSFLAKYTNRLLPGHLSALNAISRCRTPDSGELRVRCTESRQERPSHGWSTVSMWVTVCRH